MEEVRSVRCVQFRTKADRTTTAPAFDIETYLKTSRH